MSSNIDLSKEAVLTFESNVPFNLVLFLSFFLPIISGLMFGFAAFKLSSETGVAGNVSALLLTIGAIAASAGVMYVTNNVGAILAARKSKVAGIGSVSALLLVGCGLTMATFSGRVLPDVELFELQEFGAAQSVYLDQENRKASEANRASSVLRQIADNLTGWKKCEIQQNCISNSKFTGEGPITRILQGEANSAISIAGQFEEGKSARESALRKANRHLKNYQAIISDESDDPRDRRGELQAESTKLLQTITNLSQATPIDVVRQYASKLQEGVSVSDRPDVQRRINKILVDHGENLDQILEELPKVTGTKISFPPKPAVSDALSHWKRFIPTLVIIAVIDMVFPLLLWMTEYYRWSGRIRNEEAIRRKLTTGGVTAHTSQAYSNGHDNSSNALDETRK